MCGSRWIVVDLPHLLSGCQLGAVTGACLLVLGKGCEGMKEEWMIFLLNISFQKPRPCLPKRSRTSDALES
jgi:hypothetical protein